MNFRTAFVTGATGLLGNNLVRLLAERGIRVKALARSRAKAESQLGGIPGVEIVIGDLMDVAAFAAALQGADVLFHTAAYFRDSFKGGDHAAALQRVNVEGTLELLRAAYARGVRRMVHTSSIAVLDGPRGATMDETMLRTLPERDPYYRSKMLADAQVLAFLGGHPDFHASLVLPGWMHGPGDCGPTAAGQAVLDFVRGKLPGVAPATVSFVDARDVAWAQLAAAERGRRGEHYLAAGRHMDIAEFYRRLDSVTGVPAPTRKVPAGLLYLIAGVSELLARTTGKPALLSWATVRLLMQERERTRFDHAKSEAELGLSFRPVEQTLADEVAWFRANGMLPADGRAGTPPGKGAAASA